ncbi:unnamed protein product [Lymnaea stagnalis]|uniref:Uncharacterized protein n=1 Tax=Lymnaea stagnalis TaxID=6523 RepID=A0AAV2I3E7_LYMST
MTPSGPASSTPSVTSPPSGPASSTPSVTSPPSGPASSTPSVTSPPTVPNTPTTPQIPVDSASTEEELTTGSKWAIGIIVPLCIVALVLVGVWSYRRYHCSRGSFKTFFNQKIRYRAYTNAGYKDDEVQGTQMRRFQ